ncbi:MAG TPA: flagellar basal body L-ring protein FlgH [Armatimonadota bacterium]|nr:flagellar basal body L-ring protein FlgH [Armatimonadota bacterium]
MRRAKKEMLRGNRRALLLAALACAGMVCAPVTADSLWKSGSSLPLVADRRARQVGDLLTVAIAESAVASQQATTQSAKKQSATVEPSTGILRMLPQVGYSDGHTYNGQGTTSRSATLSARMTVKVTEVKPDGSLMVEGSRLLVVNEERQELRLTGCVRSEDIGADNVISSAAICDAQITCTGKGPVGRAQKPGFITRLIRMAF